MKRSVVKCQFAFVSSFRALLKRNPYNFHHKESNTNFSIYIENPVLFPTGLSSKERFFRNLNSMKPDQRAEILTVKAV